MEGLHGDTLPWPLLRGDHCREVKIRVNVEMYVLSASTKINGHYTEVAIGGSTVSEKLAVIFLKQSIKLKFWDFQTEGKSTTNIPLEDSGFFVEQQNYVHL